MDGLPQGHHSGASGTFCISRTGQANYDTVLTSSPPVSSQGLAEQGEGPPFQGTQLCPSPAWWAGPQVYMAGDTKLLL